MTESNPDRMIRYMTERFLEKLCKLIKHYEPGIELSPLTMKLLTPVARDTAIAVYQGDTLDASFAASMGLTPEELEEVLA